MSNEFARDGVDVAWCPGCGNFGILKLMEEVLSELGRSRREVVIVSGIGQAAKTPYYIDANMFCGLHGRALPLATAVKTANPGLCVVAEGGDGDMYGEGGNHFMHAVRRNVNLVHVVHNNMVYGLTKGQASPTSQRGFATSVQRDGVINEPFNPIAVALSLNASFVSRVFVGNREHAKMVLKAAFEHPGYALVDIFQPCVTFNPVNTYEWFREHTYELDGSGTRERIEALRLAFETDPMPLGIFRREERPTFEACIRRSSTPLYQLQHDMRLLQRHFDRL